MKSGNPHKDAAQPFIKWAGGKRAVIPFLAPHFPDYIKTYREPFVGGGAVFFTFADRIGQAYLSDTNKDLIITYQVIKHDVERLIDVLDEHKRMHMKMAGCTYSGGNSHYKKIRSQHPKSDTDIAARFIYLNKTCFNGLYRVNKTGQFNVPEGSYRNPAICDPVRLRKCSLALQKAHIRLCDFEDFEPRKGDVIYCDPPYDGCFAQYQKDGFGRDDQKRLAEAAHRWDKIGAKVILSNSDTEFMRNLYPSWKTFTAKIRRSIGQKVASRTKAAELVISNVVWRGKCQPHR